MSQAKDYINAILTLVLFVLVLPVLLVAIPALMAWEFCFGKPEAQGGESWESSEWE